MNAEIKDKWTQALESGEYQQTTEVLRNEQGYCCLGVLCDIWAKEQSDSDKAWADINAYASAVAEDLPGYVVDWAGLNHSNPMIKEDTGISDFISSFNDIKGKTFVEISKLIKKQL